MPGAGTQPKDGAVVRPQIVRRRVLQLRSRHGSAGAPAARFEEADDASFDHQGHARLRRRIEAIGDLLGCGGCMRRRGLAQQLQPAADRADQRVRRGMLDPRRVLQGLQQHRRGMLAVQSNGTAASAGQRHGVACPNVDKDMVGARPRPLDRGDQALAALVRAQLTHRTPALVGAPLVDLPVETAANVVLVERKPPNRGESGGAGEGGVVQGRRPRCGLHRRHQWQAASEAVKHPRRGSGAPGRAFSGSRPELPLPTPNRVL